MTRLPVSPTLLAWFPPLWGGQAPASVASPTSPAAAAAAAAAACPTWSRRHGGLVPHPSGEWLSGFVVGCLAISFRVAIVVPLT